MENKYSFFECYGLLWKRIFDYKGTSGLREFWFPFILNALIGAVAGILTAVYSFTGLTPLIVIAIILLVYEIISLIPFIALTVRRLKDAGKSGWLSLLGLIVGIGTIFLLMLCACASIYVVSENINADIYGPPELEIIDIEDDEEDGEFDPINNVGDEIYGPPEMLFGDDEEDDEDEGEGEDFQLEFDPSLNEEICIYGPPEMMGGQLLEDEDLDNKDSDNNNTNGKSKADQYKDGMDAKSEDINGAGEGDEDSEVGFSFNPGLNEEMCIYGPPEMLEEKSKGDH